jgi:hypothetical protein
MSKIGKQQQVHAQIDEVARNLLDRSELNGEQGLMQWLQRVCERVDQFVVSTPGTDFYDDQLKTLDSHKVMDMCVANTMLWWFCMGMRTMAHHVVNHTAEDPWVDAPRLEDPVDRFAVGKNAIHAHAAKRPAASPPADDRPAKRPAAAAPPAVPPQSPDTASDAAAKHWAFTDSSPVHDVTVEQVVSRLQPHCEYVVVGEAADRCLLYGYLVLKEKKRARQVKDLFLNGSVRVEKGGRTPKEARDYVCRKAHKHAEYGDVPKTATEASKAARVASASSPAPAIPVPPPAPAIPVSSPAPTTPVPLLAVSGGPGALAPAMTFLLNELSDAGAVERVTRLCKEDFSGLEVYEQWLRSHQPFDANAAYLRAGSILQRVTGAWAAQDTAVGERVTFSETVEQYGAFMYCLAVRATLERERGLPTPAVSFEKMRRTVLVCHLERVRQYVHRSIFYTSAPAPPAPTCV